MREAANRAGMPLGEWLRSTLLSGIADNPEPPARGSQPDDGRPGSVAEQHRRIDALASEIGRSAHRDPPPTPHRGSRAGAPREDGLVSALDALNRRIGALLSEPSRPDTAGSAQVDATMRRLNERLESRAAVSPPAAPGAEPTALDRRLGEIVKTVETLNRKLDTAQVASDEPALQAAVAEIAARQRSLDTVEPASPVPQTAPAPTAARVPEPLPLAAEAPSINLSGLERQLNLIADQMQELRNAPPMGEAIDAMHRDIDAMKRALSELAPRHIVEELENAVAALSARLDSGHGKADSTNAEMARALGELRGMIEGLRPPESPAHLAGEIEALARKLDIVNAKTVDGATVARLQAQTAEIRDLLDRALSMDSVRMLAEQIEALVVKMDRLATPDENLIRDVVGALEKRIDALGERIDASGAARHDPAPFDNLNRRLDELQASVAGVVQAAPEGMETLLQGLVERVERLSRRKSGPDDGGTERAIGALEQQLVALAEKIGANDMQPGQLANIERGMADLFIQMEEARASAVAAAQKGARDIVAEIAAALPTDSVASIKRDLADLESRQETTERRTYDTLEAVHETLERVVDRITSLEQPVYVPAQAEVPPQPAVSAPRVAGPHDAQPRESTPAVAEPDLAPPVDEADEVRLPDDFPLEPGSGDPRQRGASASARVAQSEAALQDLALNPEDGPNRADFIAAARRAAQAATSHTKSARDDAAPSGGSRLSRLLTRARLPLLIAVSSAALALVALQLTGGLRGGAPRTSEIAPAKGAATGAAGASALRPVATQPVGSVVNVKPASTATADPMAQVPASGVIGIPELLARPTVPTTATTGDITGSVPVPAAAQQPRPAAGAASGGELPANVGGSALRTAATSGNPAAAYEIGARYAEGRGVAPDLARAAYWFEQAAAKGSAPAAYRLAALLEKGAEGVARDAGRARKLYSEAAEAGNVRSMHNLAVLLAEGVDGQPDYRQASDWFLKAAERGVRDSQYNLGVLYARGLGVKPDLAESWKWFSLAANQGDAEAARKRDEVETRLAKPTLVAARFAVQTWSPVMTDDAANIVAANPDWDQASSVPAATTPAVKRKTASRS